MPLSRLVVSARLPSANSSSAGSGHTKVSAPTLPPLLESLSGGKQERGFFVTTPKNVDFLSTAFASTRRRPDPHAQDEHAFFDDKRNEQGLMLTENRGAW